MATELERLGYHEGAAFHCQQAAEKLLAALLIRRTKTIPQSHSCVDLLETIAGLGLRVPDALATCARRLERHSIDAQHANGLDGTPENFYDETIAAEAVRDAQAITSFARDHLEAPAR